MKMIKYILILVMLVLTGQAFCATRLYLPSSGAADVAPAYDAGWDTTYATRLKCVTTRINTAMITDTMGTGTTVTDYLSKQYVSAPIDRQTISGTVNGWVRGMLSNNGTFYPAVLIKVVSYDGNTVRGTLMPMTYGATTYPRNTLTNRTCPPSTSLNVVTAEAGDRIVIAIGVRNQFGSSRERFQNFGDDSATDLSTDGETAANNPWVEFSQDIQFFKGRTVLAD